MNTKTTLSRSRSPANPATSIADSAIAVLDGARKSPSGWTARCPAHDDARASLSIAERNGRVLLHCFAGCSYSDVMSAIEARQRGESPTPIAAKKSQRGSSSPASSNVSGLTIESLAKERGLTVEFLTRLGLRNLPFKSGVEIPYKDETGAVVLYKERHAGAVKFRWPFGAPLMVYGLWLLKLARSAKRLVLVEGESDSWTLWHHAIPALGIPGAAAVARTLQAQHLAGIDDLLIVEEADTGGATFKREVCARLRAINYKGRVSVLEMALTGSKDISDLYRADRKSFGRGLKSWGK